jgi:hypothetical protein
MSCMCRVRHFLGLIAAAWLFCSAATLAFIPALVESSIAECVCTHDANAMCPMHHRATGGAKVCAIQSATTSVPAFLQSLLSVTGPLPTSARLIAADPTTSVVWFRASTPTHLTSPPDPLPPRA